METFENDELALLQEQLSFWHEMVTTLQLELQSKEQQIQEIDQELQFTNQELCDALTLQKLNVDQVKELAKICLKSNKSVSECLATVLNEIYGSAIQPKELEHLEELSTPKIPLNKANNHSCGDRVNQFKSRFTQLQAQSEKMQSLMFRAKDNLKAMQLRNQELISEYKQTKANSNCVLPPPRKKTKNKTHEKWNYTQLNKQLQESLIRRNINIKGTVKN